MKKVLLSAVAILGFTFANAQEEEAATTAGFAQGDMFISGSFGINSFKQDDFKSSEFSIAPSFNYFVTENISVGGKIGYASATDAVIDSFEGEDLPYASTADYNKLTFGAMGRYYFTPANQFSLFGQLGLDYGISTITKFDEVDIDEDNKVNSLNLGLGLGMNYFVSSNFSLEAGIGVLGYQTSKGDWDGAEAANTFMFGADMTNISFGVNYKF